MINIVSGMLIAAILDGLAKEFTLLVVKHEVKLSKDV
jgi:hypothetical protein